MSPGTAGDLHRAAFWRGYELLGYGRRNRGVFPQQLRTVDVLSQGRRHAAILEPRQSSKTTSIECYLVGLCDLLPGLQVGYIAGTSGKAGTNHYLTKIAAPIEAVWPERKTRPIEVRKGFVGSRLTWPSGSMFMVCLTAEDFRGFSFDIAWVDEAGELDGDEFLELRSAILPTQDTRKGEVIEQPLTIWSGTAGRSRADNALWTYLERGREDDPNVSILEYSAGTFMLPEDWDSWEQTEPLLLAAHPGIGTLTDLATVRENYNSMDRERFGREYLGIFSERAGLDLVLPPRRWSDATLTGDLPEPPEHFTLAMAASRHQTCAAIVAAWRVDGIAYVVVLDWREGVDWLPGEVARLAAKYPRALIAHDDRGPVTVEAGKIAKAHPRIRLKVQNYVHAQQAAQLFTRELSGGRLRHFGQAHLNEGAASAVRRDAGRGWLFGSKTSDITALEAASLALRLYDETPPKRRLPGVMVAD